MTTGVILEPSVRDSIRDRKTAGLKITVFHCNNAVADTIDGYGDCEVRCINMPCTGMIREAALLKAFEAGADAVLVLACPEGTCRYLEGNIRARKRTATVKKLLDEIGLGGRRLNFHNLPHQDPAAVECIIGRTVEDLAVLGPSPAR